MVAWPEEVKYPIVGKDDSSGRDELPVVDPVVDDEEIGEEELGWEVKEDAVVLDNEDMAVLDEKGEALIVVEEVGSRSFAIWR